MRIWALIWQATVGYVATIVIGLIAFVWAIVDLLWQLVLGSDGLDSSSTTATHIGDAFRWSVGQTLFTITGGGDGEFRWLWTT